MPRTVSVVIEIEDRGTARVRGLADSIERDSKRAKRAAETNFSRMTKSVGGQLDKLSTRFLRWGSLAGGIFAGLATRAVISFGSTFEQRMSGVRAVTQATEGDFRSLVDQARDLGATTAFTATQAAEAMEELGKAGFDSATILATLPDVLNLAGAGTLEMADAASITVDVLKSLGVEVEDFAHATDVLAKTATSSKTTVAELGFAFQDSAPLARALGIGIEDLSALFGVLADRGFTATRAGTALRRIFTVFLGDLEEGEKGLGDYADQLVYTSDGALDFVATLRNLEEAGFDAAAAMDAFDLRGGPAFLNIMNAGADAVEEFSGTLQDADGEALRVFQERFDNLAGLGKELASALQEVGLVVFDKVAPGLKAGAEGAIDFVRSWGEALSVSDVARGFERAVDLARLAVLGLSVALATKLVVSARAGLLAATQLALGFDKVAFAAATASGAVSTFANLTLAQKAGFVGLAGAIGVATYQITRMALEVSGLDAVLQDVFDRALNSSGDFVRGIRSGEEAVSLIVRNLERLEGLGIDVALPDELAPLVSQIREAGDLTEALDRRTGALFDRIRREQPLIGANEALRIATSLARREFDDLEEALGRNRVALGDLALNLGGLRKRAAEASETVRGDLASAMLEAGREGLQGAEQIARALEIVDDRAAAAAKEREDADRRAAAGAKERREAVAALQEVLDDSRFATSAMGAALADELQPALAGARLVGIDVANVYEAVADQVIATTAAIHRAGQDVPADLAAIAGGVLDLLASQTAFQLGIDEGGIVIDPTRLVSFGTEGETDGLGARLRDELDETIGAEIRDWILDQDPLTMGPVVAPPEDGPSAWEDYFGEIERVAETFVENVGFFWADFVEGAISGFGNLVGSIVAGQQSLAEGFKKLGQQLLAQGVSLLVQWGIQRLLTGKLAVTATASEGAAQLATSLAAVYANAFASTAAIPIVGPALAPGVASASLAAATAGATGAGASGAALGAGLATASGVLPGAATGALVTAPQVVQVGEYGRREAIVPLEGSAAKRVRRDLGLDGTQGGSPITVSASFGDVLSEDVPERLVLMVADRLAELIQSGRVLSLPAGARS